MLTAETDSVMTEPSYSHHFPRSDASNSIPLEEDKKGTFDPPADHFESPPLTSANAVNIPIVAELATKEVRRSPAIRILPPKGVKSGIASQVDVDEDGLNGKRRRRPSKVATTVTSTENHRPRRASRPSSTTENFSNKARNAKKLGKLSRAGKEGGTAKVVGIKLIEREPALRRSPRKSDPEATADEDLLPANSALVPPTNTIRIRLRASTSPPELDTQFSETTPKITHADTTPSSKINVQEMVVVVEKKRRKRISLVEVEQPSFAKDQAEKPIKRFRQRKGTDETEALTTDSTILPKKPRRKSKSPVVASDDALPAGGEPDEPKKSPAPKIKKVRLSKKDKSQVLPKPQSRRRGKKDLSSETAGAAKSPKKRAKEVGEDDLILGSDPANKQSVGQDAAADNVPIVNDEYCSACSGAGSLICCESCPRSFHFTCVDPPIDPDNVPDEDWFCNDCQAKVKRLSKLPREIKNMEDIWNVLIEKAKAMNPKVFTLPKRIRKLAEEDEELIAEREALTREAAELGQRRIKLTPEQSDILGVHVEEAHYPPHESTFPRSPRERISVEGHCHKCCKSAGREPYQQLIRCDNCSLLWHLDCLPYALPVYPSSHRPWYCPVHLTLDNLADLMSPDAAERVASLSKGQLVRINDWPASPPPRNDLPILPEFSVRLQFGWSSGSVSFPDHSQGCSVPQGVRLAYEEMRSLPTQQATLLAYYSDFSYKDQSVETDASQ